MSVSLYSDYNDIEEIKRAVLKQKGELKLPYDTVIKVFMDHASLVRETGVEDFKLSDASLFKLGTALSGKVGSTGIVKFQRMLITHLIYDHEMMMELVEKKGLKYEKV